MHRRSWRSFSICVALAAVLIGCSGGSGPSPSVGGMDDVIANLVLRGVTVHRLVSGDAACPGSTLHSNAISLEVALFNQSALHQVYLFRWRRPADFDAAGAAFADCVAEYAASHPLVQVGRLERAPWRAYGPAWTEELQGTLEQALRATGGG